MKEQKNSRIFLTSTDRWSRKKNVKNIKS